jgi:hypothetical protein
MGRHRINKYTDQDIYANEQAPHAKKRLQKIHCSSHPLGGRPKNRFFPPLWTEACHDLSTIDYGRLPIQPTLRTVTAPFNSFWFALPPMSSR